VSLRDGSDIHAHFLKTLFSRLTALPSPAEENARGLEPRHECCELSYISIPARFPARERQHMPPDVLKSCLPVSARYVLGDRDHDNDDGFGPPDPDVLRQPFLTFGPCRHAQGVIGFQAVQRFEAEILKVAAQTPELIQAVLPSRAGSAATNASSVAKYRLLFAA